MWRVSSEAIKSELLKEPSISQVGGISNLPGGQFNQNDLFLEEDRAVVRDQAWNLAQRIRVAKIGVPSIRRGALRRESP